MEDSNDTLRVDLSLTFVVQTSALVDVISLVSSAVTAVTQQAHHLPQPLVVRYVLSSQSVDISVRM